MRKIVSCALAWLGLMLVTGPAHAQESRWIRYDAQSQRYSVAARDVPRAELLADLERLARIAVRPRPDPSQTATLSARGLTLEELLARILGPETGYAIRLGARDLPVVEPTARPRKAGPPVPMTPGARAKRERSPQLVGTGNLKPAVDSAIPQPGPAGGNIKVPAKDVLRVAQGRGPKKPIEAEMPRDAIRITLKFSQGAAPVVVRARLLEGRPVHPPHVTGRYLFVVLDAGGRPIEYGTFQDPLEVHSYRPEGPHSVTEARSGRAGFSIARESLAGDRLLIIDLEGAGLDDDLTEKTVREAIARGKTVLRIDLKELAREMGPGGPR
jgi:hypothetical protein